MKAMSNDEKLEVLMSAGIDAENELRSETDDDELEELRDHLDCLACSTTLDDAVLATRVLSGMASVRATLTDALREIGVKP